MNTTISKLRNVFFPQIGNERNGPHFTCLSYSIRRLIGNEKDLSDRWRQLEWNLDAFRVALFRAFLVFDPFFDKWMAAPLTMKPQDPPTGGQT